MKHIVVAGGGAAGFFAALACAEANPDYRVIILEKSQKLLQKVSISGGGRCNVTHACFDARELVKFYPRGHKQLIGPFSRFNPTHTINWFAQRGVQLKTESDGRMFPVTDSSQTIINCFINEANRLKVAIQLGAGIDKLTPVNNTWQIQLHTGKTMVADAVIVTAGSSLQVWKMLAATGHTIVPPVPSLFTFNISDKRLQDLQGLSVSNATVSITGSKLKTSGPLLITHWGLSGPAILKASAWGARELAAINHRFEIDVNWTGTLTREEVKSELLRNKAEHPKRQPWNHPLFNIPQRLWKSLTDCEGMNYADLSKSKIESIAGNLAASHFAVHGKSTFKDEFVTAGGVDLSEVDFKTMQSKKLNGLYFAGEVLDIDAVTGGFNFQAAWTTGFVAGTSV